jgi:hypothetical protein
MKLKQRENYVPKKRRLYEMAMFIARNWFLTRNYSLFDYKRVTVDAQQVSPACRLGHRSFAHST